MTTLGISIGASTLSMVELDGDGGGRPSISRVLTELHHGNPSDLFLDRLADLEADRFDRIAVTGRTFRHFVNLTSLSEPEAMERALRHVNGTGEKVNAVVSAGGETFIVYVLSRDGKIASIQSGNKCASGTGEFFLQQIRRMGLSMEEALALGAREEPYRVSGRCSVFCKSDCTHALNKGVPKGRVVAGLCRMMAGKVLEIIKQVPKKNIMIIGGCAQNDVMIEALREDISDLVIPEEAPYFEALGAALWAFEHETAPFPGVDRVLKKGESLFFRLKPLRDAEHMVEFKKAAGGEARPGDECIIGLDVGSTTTKAILLRVADDSTLASVYLRTEGDPVRASRRCYAALVDQLGSTADEISITGLGVTGSGRQIAGLHAMTDGVINEIIAHATGALYYDADVDTIFEIGGQDAKYTSLTNGVPSDYAMNEACSAGTGSFLEEAAWETLGVPMEEIADIALQGNSPPNFNDQCAAFISSDIKNAASEGIGRDDIVAGLVYSICMNYNNRVRGNRPAGNKVFMQGGVCYNRAVPMAMAALTGKSIVVPPDPGLIGAFGVALEVKRRLSLGLMERQSFLLKALRDREIEYGKPFICKGDKDGCDRKCEIARIRINGKTYPFGGACNRWYNLRRRVEVDVKRYNLAVYYENALFGGDGGSGVPGDHPTVGINKSFLVNSYFPLYRGFFERLGFRVVLAQRPLQEGMDRKNAPFCYPAEIAHGFFQDLLERRPDYLFLPQFKGDYVPGVTGTSITCPLCQGEPYYLASAFKDHEVLRELKRNDRILGPVIDFSDGLESAEPVFTALGKTMKRGRKEAREAFFGALEEQQKVSRDIEERGREVLEKLADNPDDIAIVLFGRSYNAFVTEANMGIPNKFSSRGIPVVPLFSLNMLEDRENDRDMYWSSGRRILKAARLVKNHSQLFACYITNFSCGPDSFLVGYFRDIMGKKPSLTLELDSHVADAGLETRIEAFLDIVARYRELEKRQSVRAVPAAFRPAKVTARDGRYVYVDSRGAELPLDDKRIHLLFPSMGRFTSEAGAAIFRGFGVRSTALPPPDDEVLKIGRAHTTCKECLPLLLTTGGLLHYLRERSDTEEKLIYFMPTAGGPCRFGQYSEFLAKLAGKLSIEDTAIYSPSAENSYADLGGKGLPEALWDGIITADIFEEMYSTLLTNAVDVEAAMRMFDTAWREVIGGMETRRDGAGLQKALEKTAKDLAGIPLRRSLAETPVILLAGEIYVRHDDISRQYLVEELSRRGFAVKVASLAEWVYYTGWCVEKKVSTAPSTWKERLALRIRTAYMKRREKTIRKIMAVSGLCSGRCEDVDHVMAHTIHLMKPDLAGEAILTIGSSLNEIVDYYCGVIAIGPFGCMPNRLAEAILTREMNMEGKRSAGVRSEIVRRLDGQIDELPFLAIESDGTRFPQIITARLEAFLLQSARLHGLQREVARSGFLKEK
jgi:predicted CoA-substrate-specific enzyme activase